MNVSPGPDREIAGNAPAAVTVKTTNTFCGLFDATVDSTGIVAEYVPGARLPVTGWSVSVADGFAVVELSAGVCSHPEVPPEYAMVPVLSALSVPAPLLVIVMVVVYVTYMTMRNSRESSASHTDR